MVRPLGSHTGLQRQDSNLEEALPAQANRRRLTPSVPESSAVFLAKTDRAMSPVARAN